MTDRRTTRRAFLAGLTSSLAVPVYASAPTNSFQPLLRNAPVQGRSLPAVESIIEASKLGGKVAYAVADAQTGQLLETRSHLAAMPPASVTKAATALYAVETLGPDYRYRTQLLATGEITNGRISGDLVLVATGDPSLTSDGLGEMAKALRDAGITGVEGRFLVVPGPQPDTYAIDPDQPAQVAYNPGISGLNLNYNRVHFEWKRVKKDYEFTLEARAREFRPATRTSHLEIVDRKGPVYDFQHRDGLDHWSVARRALGKKGARWLPVRKPSDYALDAFATIAAHYEITLPEPQFVAEIPEGKVLHEVVSPPLKDVLRRMLKFSTNLTAEVVGQSATAHLHGQCDSLGHSAASMSDWLRSRTRARRPGFVDHSGLNGSNDISANDMVAALVHGGHDGAVAGMMKPWYFRNEGGGKITNHPVKMFAKTGTLNFVSGLAGYVVPPSGRALAFAIFAADEPRRDAIPMESRERPAGTRSWARRARTLDDRLLKRWTSLYS